MPEGHLVCVMCILSSSIVIIPQSISLVTWAVSILSHSNSLCDQKHAFVLWQARRDSDCDPETEFFLLGHCVVITNSVEGTINAWASKCALLTFTDVCLWKPGIYNIGIHGWDKADLQCRGLEKRNINATAFEGTVCVFQNREIFYPLCHCSCCRQTVFQAEKQ